MSAAVVSGRNTLPVFKLCGHVLRNVACFIQATVVRWL